MTNVPFARLLTPRLCASNPDLIDLAADSWRALGAVEPRHLFRYGLGNTLVRIIESENGHATQQPLTSDRLGFELQRAAEWWKPGRGVKEIPARPPQHLLQDMIADPDPQLPRLMRLTHTPVFGRQGNLVVTPGYDARAQVYFAPPADLRDRLSELKFIDGASVDDVAWALEQIYDVLWDFPFMDAADRTHAVALWLQPYVRDLIIGPTPLHLIWKTKPGTGGTLLAEVIHQSVTGADLEVMVWPSWAPEAARTLTGRLLGSPTYLVLDNVTELDSGTLCAAITSSVWTDRKLGSSDTPAIPVRCAWAATGNEPVLSAEIRRRTIPIRLDAGVDAPERRTGFRHPQLRKHIAEHRVALVKAAITLVRAWQAAGQPLGTRTLGMFESWAEVIGGILDVAGVPGFLTTVLDTPIDDRRTRAMTDLLHRWWQAFGAHEVGVSEVYPLAHADPPIVIELGLQRGGSESSDSSHKTALGKRLQEYRDRLLGNYRLRHCGSRQGAQQWRLERTPPSELSVSDVEPPSNPQGRSEDCDLREVLIREDLRECEQLAGCESL